MTDIEEIIEDIRHAEVEGRGTEFVVLFAFADGTIRAASTMPEQRMGMLIHHCSVKLMLAN